VTPFVPTSDLDTPFLKQAIQLAREHMNLGHGGPFGAVIVREKQVVAEGWNQVTTALDPTAHAEIVAIRNASAQLQNFDLSGCIIYCSCEPCPMCLAAIYWARLDRLVFAASRQDAARAGFDDEFLYQEIPRPFHSRQLPTQQSHRECAEEVFDEWLAKADRVPY